ncbi:MAG: hypothetical protein ACRECQ_06715, partial [Burkholderiaceae bacterium]
DGRIDYRFAGAGDGVEWTMWYDSDRGDKSPDPKAYWKSANVRTPRLSLVIIGSKRYQMESGAVGRLLMDVVTGVAQAVSREAGDAIRADKSEFYESAVTLEGGRATFRERFTVALSPDMPRHWFDDELQQLLLKWPEAKLDYRSEEKVEVTLRPDGLQIVAEQMPEAFAFWNHLAQLGEALARRLSRLAH